MGGLSGWVGWVGGLSGWAAAADNSCLAPSLLYRLPHCAAAPVCLPSACRPSLPSAHTLQLVAFEVTKLSPTEFEQHPVEHSISGLSGHLKPSWNRCLPACLAGPCCPFRPPASLPACVLTAGGACGQQGCAAGCLPCW